MIRSDITLKLFRLILFPVLMLIEGTLLVLFLTQSFYQVDSPDIVKGYSLVWGWVLAVIGFLLIIDFLLLFLTAFNYKNEKVMEFFSNNRAIRIITLATSGVLFAQIAILAVSQIFYTFLNRDYTSIYLIIIALSLILPVLLVFIGNLEPESEIPYSLSPETPMRLKLTTLWLAFLAGAMQIFAVEWSFVIIGTLVLAMTVYFFYLSRYAAVVIPSILLIHFVFSTVIAIVSLVNMENFIQELIAAGGSITDPQVYAIVFAVFITPGIISLVLAQSFFRKWVLKWIREVRPEPKMEIELEFAD
ncbi:MAG: hypothetical protein FK733_11490 [Asgard group archaeon]|nr:hypothetical protein [Asgard group archaeon]